MNERGLVLEWGASHPGHEMGMGVFNSAIQYYTARKEEGAIADLRIYLHAAGGLDDRAGTLVVQGSSEQINNLLADEDHIELIIAAEHVSKNFSLTRS